jgi:hypothetical protein
MQLDVMVTLQACIQEVLILNSGWDIEVSVAFLSPSRQISTFSRPLPLICNSVFILPSGTMSAQSP